MAARRSSVAQTGMGGTLVLAVAALLVATAGYRLVLTRWRRGTTITTGSWETFQRGLMWELARLDAGTRVVIAAATTPRAFVQFARDADRLRAETASTRFVSSGARQSAAQEQRLEEAGWQAPDKRNPNWWIDRQPQLLSAADYQQLAGLAVLTLHEVLEIAEPREPRYRAWNDTSHKPVVLAGLHPTEQ